MKSASARGSRNVFEMMIMLVNDLLSDSPRLAVFLSGLLLSAAPLILVGRTSEIKKKLVLLRLHISLLFSPLLFMAFTWRCGMPISSCSSHVLLFSIPFSVFLSYVAGLLIVPRLYAKRLGLRHLKDTAANKIAGFQLSGILGSTPELYSIDVAEPVAFVKAGRRPSIHLSIGLIELLSPKELEAVMLHETYHLKSHSSEIKFASAFSKIVSPFRWFDKHQSNDELEADKFASCIQRTTRFITTARRKINKFYGYSCNE